MSKLIGRLLVVLAFGWAGSANAGLLVNLSINFTDDSMVCGVYCGDPSAGGITTGYAFTLSSPITVDGLGIWDWDGDGIGPSVPVGLWIDGGALLASVQISGSTPLEFSNSEGGWRMEDIAELVLAPGNYVLGSPLYNGSPSLVDYPSFTMIPEVTDFEPRDAIPNMLSPTKGLARPDYSNLDHIILGPNLRLAPAAAPVPATLYLLGISLTALGYSRRKRKLHC